MSRKYSSEKIKCKCGNGRWERIEDGFSIGELCGDVMHFKCMACDKTITASFNLIPNGKNLDTEVMVNYGR